MQVFEVVVALLVGGALMAMAARRVGAPYPALLAVAGVVLALLPGVPTLVLDPELALALFVAPVLVDAAFDSSPRDLARNWRPITGLAVGAVLVTIAAVALVVRALVPGMPWAAAIALGAIVAPPDAAAASTVLKQLRPPHKLLVILEGESLFNDASALLVYRLAVGAAVTGAVSGWTIAPMLVGVTLGSVALGLALSWLTLRVSERIHDVATAIVLQFGWTFGVWILAERLHLSGIITMVVFAMAAARRAPDAMPARTRIPAWAFWEVAVFVLNVLAFILVGFQLRSIGERVTGAVGLEYAFVAGAVCATVVLARFAWVTLAAAVGRWRSRSTKSWGLTARAAAVMGWSGMRGTVTLAAALALPGAHGEGPPFPHRDLIVVTAFGVVLGTLVLQGLTLRPLLVRLRLRDDGSVERETRLARVEALRAAVAEVVDADPGSLVRQSLETQLRYAREAWERDGAGAAPAPGAGGAHPLQAGAALLRAATEAQRQCLSQLRADGTIGDAAFQVVLEELDWMEVGWAQVMPTETDGPGAA